MAAPTVTRVMQLEPSPPHTPHTSRKPASQHTPASSSTGLPQHFPRTSITLAAPPHTPQASRCPAPAAQHPPVLSSTGHASPAAAQHPPDHRSSSPEVQQEPSPAMMPPKQLGGVVQRSPDQPAAQVHLSATASHEPLGPQSTALQKSVAHGAALQLRRTALMSRETPSHVLLLGEETSADDVLRAPVVVVGTVPGACAAPSRTTWVALLSASVDWHTAVRVCWPPPHGAEQFDHAPSSAKLHVKTSHGAVLHARCAAGAAPTAAPSPASSARSFRTAATASVIAGSPPSTTDIETLPAPPPPALSTHAAAMRSKSVLYVWYLLVSPVAAIAASMASSWSAVVVHHTARAATPPSQRAEQRPQAPVHTVCAGHACSLHASTMTPADTKSASGSPEAPLTAG
mmetsp:Transcript_4360/g.10590  ORF Transcript_4360/g.10590 Transcript_4360/m.10590 type:complete len:401 (+) Transcript_4360:746-1948(+)